VTGHRHPGQIKQAEHCLVDHRFREICKFQLMNKVGYRVHVVLPFFSGTEESPAAGGPRTGPGQQMQMDRVTQGGGESVIQQPPD
jgi:hypothetical protein